MSRTASEPDPRLSKHRLGLRARVASIAGGLFLVIGIVSAILYVVMISRFEQDSLSSRADHRARVEAASLAYPLWTLDEPALERALDALTADPDHQAVRILNPSGGLIKGRGASTINSVRATRQIVMPDGQNVRSLGSIEVTLSTKRIDDASANRLIAALLVGLGLSMLLTFVVYTAAGRWVLRPIEQLAKSIEDLTSGSVTSQTVPLIGQFAEFAILKRALEGLMDDRRRAERLAVVEAEAVGVQAAQRRLVDAIESLAEGIVLWDQSGYLVVCNQKFRDICKSFNVAIRPGIAFDEVMAAAFNAGVFENDPMSGPALTPAWCNQNSQEEQHLQVTTRDGAVLSIADRRMADGGRVAIYRDVTEAASFAKDLRAQTEAAETARREATAASRAKSEFLANMSHELRTPLNAIIGFSEIMEGELFGPVGQPRYLTYIADIHRAGKHLLGLVNDLLDLSRIDAGKLMLDRENLETAALVQSVSSLVKPQADKQGVTIELELGIEAIWGDRRALLQILLNLISNAVKFTLPRGIVTLSITRAEDHGAYLRVRDTGVGMTQTEVMMAREKFGQVNSTLVSKRQGTGLGLPIAEGLVNAHGSTLEIESEKGVGTVVWFHLPPQQAGPGKVEAADDTPTIA